MLKKIQMMKKRILSICFALCFVHMTGMAQHYVGAMVDGAAAWQLDNMEDTYQMLGGGTSVGGLYQMRYDKFLLQTGLGASQVWLRQGLHVDSIARDMYDSEGYAFTYCGELYNQTHQAMVTEVMVPFMLGTKIRSFHLLVGAKLSLTVIGYTTQKAKLNTWVIMAIVIMVCLPICRNMVSLMERMWKVRVLLVSVLMRVCAQSLVILGL